MRGRQLARARSCAAARAASSDALPVSSAASASNTAAASENWPSRPSSAASSLRRAGRAPGTRGAAGSATPRTRRAHEERLLQIGEHAVEDGARAHRQEVVVVEALGGTVHLGEQVGTRGGVEAGAAVERVVELVGPRPHQEVAGHAHTVQRDAARRPTSIIRTLSVIGMPSRRSSTSSRYEFAGS